MYHLSDYVVQLIIKERQQDQLRRIENRRLARIARGEGKGSILTRLKDMANRLLSSPKRTQVEPTENELIMAEFLGLSPEKLRQLESKRRFYERIMRGNALVEVEYQTRKMQEGRR